MSSKFPTIKAVRTQTETERFRHLGMDERTVYVRQLFPGDALWEQIESDIEDASQDLFAVVSASGEPLAVVNDRAAAFAGARRHDLTPVSAH